MRKVQGIKSLMDYLASVDYPLSEETVNRLILTRDLPHSIAIKNMIIFDLSHIDWWIAEKRKLTE